MPDTLSRAGGNAYVDINHAANGAAATGSSNSAAYEYQESVNALESHGPGSGGPVYNVAQPVGAAGPVYTEATSTTAVVGVGDGDYAAVVVATGGEAEYDVGHPDADK